MKEKEIKLSGLCTNDHAELIASVWAGISEEQKQMLMRSVAEALRGAHPEDGPGHLRLSEVLKAGWCLGFEFCMIAVEAGTLVKLGKPQNN